MPLLFPLGAEAAMLRPSTSSSAFQAMVINIYILYQRPLSLNTIVALHDLAEAELGHPGNGVRSAVAWAELEEEVFSRLYPALADLFRQYRRGEGPLGVLVSFADKLATLLRACRYKERGYPTEDLIEAFVERLSKYPEPYPAILRRYLGYCGRR
ncbi:MAG: hypothetical protein JZD41_06405 [Thermoproteus sp.]|nr:hypothetical protein [Thermoproteus sp.]